MSQVPFEMPKEMREMAAKNVEQAQAAYHQFTEAITQAMGMWTKAMPANQMAPGFTALQERAAKFAKQNAETGFALASDIAKAKDIQEVLALQSRYAQTQMQSIALQTQELGQIMSEAAQGAAKNMTPKI